MELVARAHINSKHLLTICLQIAAGKASLRITTVAGTPGEHGTSPRSCLAKYFILSEAG